MKTYLGNYLGLVVDDRDPQNRGRVKIFIPHIMPTLYEGWNKEGKDISINITDSSLSTGLDIDTLNRLQKILPWAECAAPVFGAGPSGKLNYGNGTLDQVVQQVGNKNFDPQKQGASSGEMGNAIASVPSSSANGLPSNVRLESGKQLPNSSLISVLSEATNRVYGAGASVEIFSGHREYTGTTTRHSGDWAADVVFRDASGNSITGDNLAPIVKYWHDNNLGSTGLNGGNEYSRNPAMARDGAIHMDLVGGRYGRPLESGEALYWVYRGSLSPAMQNAISNIAPNKQSYIQTGVQASNENPSIEPFINAGINDDQPNKDPISVQDNNTRTPDTTITAVKKGMGLSSNALAENAAIAYKTAYEQSIAKGVTPAQANIVASAIVGNIARESGFQANLSHDGGIGYGLLGENQEILDRMLQYANSKGENRQSGISVQTQIEALFNEPSFIGSSARKGGFSGLINSGNVSAAAELFAKGYLIPAAATANYQERVNNALAAAQTFSNVDLASITGTSTQAIADATAQPVVQSPSQYPTVGGRNTNYMPTGMFGGARAGQTVWVFFQEGNPLFPVYFAASYSEKEWSNVSQGSSNPPTKNELDIYQNAEQVASFDGGGFASQQIISGQASGFENDEFVFQVFGKNGSALTFTALATILASKYDFRQHTQADAHYITGGNREDRTVGNHNVVCEQDLIFTVGNWTQEALDAASEIQKVIDEAMKAAKDTYEA